MAPADLPPSLAPPAHTFGMALMQSTRRWRLAALLGPAWGLLMSIGSGTPTSAWLTRTCTVVVLVVAAFALSERCPSRLPRWLARWVLQLAAVVVAVPIAAFIGYCLSDTWPFWQQKQRLQGFLIVSFTGILIGPWLALGALVRQRETWARTQALAFSLERSELERQALEARLQLLQAQVQPHFLFNTLANVRALVSAGSPQAPQVLDSLIAYLRAAVPRLQAHAPTVDQELQLVRAYLALMQMRIPDRLQYALQVDPATLPLRCPPLTLLTLVENAVRHGIDPCEDGGRIDITLQRHGQRCLIQVIDTGLGLTTGQAGLGTGLSTLRERLQLAFGDSIRLQLSTQAGRGTCAELDMPAELPASTPTTADRGP